MKAKLVKENIGGAGGAGYSVWGGGWGRSFGNPSMGGRFYGRGFGFGGSSNNGGPNIMYTYDVKPLNQLLQQPGTPQGDHRYIHTGSEINGKILGKDKEIFGKIIDIKKDEEQYILYYIVQDLETAEKFNVDPTSVELTGHEEIPNSAMMDFMRVGESFYPTFHIFLNEEEKSISTTETKCPHCKKTSNYSITHYKDLKPDQNILFTCPHCKKDFQGKIKKNF